MAQPLLSIGMIVKNEIWCLEKCLKALQPLREAIPCELVIADTGSNDGTREIAQKYADICFDFVWINDFSAARNAVLDRCSGKWTLTVDADEYLDANFSQLVEFLTSPEESRYRLAVVNVYNYSDVEMKGPGADFLAPRMARLDTHPRYTGLIHESLPGARQDQIKILMDVKFHHNGYATDPKHPEKRVEKSLRNLNLLHRELEKEPNDLRRLLQCVETSGPFPAEKMDYVRRGMKVLVQQKKTQAGQVYGPVLSCHALEAAEKYDMPELEKWRRWAFSTYPDHMFLRLDANYALVKYYVRKKKYEEIPPLASAFLCAWQDFQDRNFDLSVLMRSVLRCTSRYAEAVVRASGGEALVRLGRREEAARLLVSGPDWTGLQASELRTFLKGCAWAAEEDVLQDFIARNVEPVRAMESKEGNELWEALLASAESTFHRRDEEEKGPEHPWRMFARVEGTLGRAAALMEAENCDAARELLFQIEEWEEVPSEVVARMIELGAVLPDGFYRQKRERLQQVAVYLGGMLDGGVLLNWMDQRGCVPVMGGLQFRLDLLTTVLQLDKTWEGEADWRASACDKFLNTAADYLPRYYSPQLLADEAEWTVLPGVHRFALCLLQGRKIKEGGDLAGYLRFLRQGLGQASKMKKMIRFLADEAEKEARKPAANPELESLAEQVRAILARYAPDDPAVLALKRTEAYQKVAYLLELRNQKEETDIQFL